MNKTKITDKKFEFQVIGLVIADKKSQTIRVKPLNIARKDSRKILELSGVD